MKIKIHLQFKNHLVKQNLKNKEDLNLTDKI